MKQTRKTFFYFVYIIVATAFFLYMLFPSDVVKAYIVTHANGVDPNLRIRVDDVTPALPPGIRIVAASLYCAQHVVFSAERITVSPQYAKLIQPDTAFILTGTAHGGRLKGTLTIEKDNPVVLDTKLFDIQLERIPAVQSLFKEGVSGRCSGTIRYRSKTGTGGVFDSNLSISDVTVEISNRSLNLDTLIFDQISANIVLDNDRLHIKKCDVASRQGNAKFTGTILLRNPREKSTLNVTGTLKPNQVLLAAIRSTLPKGVFARVSSGKKDLTLQLRGAFENPTVRFD
jgi:type II secretion system protein N